MTIKIIVIGQKITWPNKDIFNFGENLIKLIKIDLKKYNYLIVSGGDGLLRRIVDFINNHYILSSLSLVFIINPRGTFNLFSLFHPRSRLSYIKRHFSEIYSIKRNKEIYRKIPFFSINGKVFIFSAGNGIDVIYIALAEVLRFKKCKILRYVLSMMVILPIFLLSLPYLLVSKKVFFFMAPFKKKIFNLKYNPKNLQKSYFNLVQLDGDLEIIKEQIKIKQEGFFTILEL